jgi:hypothetical protein
MIDADSVRDVPSGSTVQRNDDSIVPLPRDTRMPSNPRLAGEEGGRSSAWISYATGTQTDSDYIRSIYSEAFVMLEI